MLVTTKYVAEQKNYINTSSNVSNPRSFVSTPPNDTVSFKAKPISAGNALKFLVPIALGSMGITRLLPDTLVQKLYNIELEDFEQNLIFYNGSSKEQEILSHISDVKQFAEENPDKIKIIENLLRKGVLNSLGNINSFSKDNPELLNAQLEFLNRMANEKKYQRHIDAANVVNSGTKKPYTLQDIEAKNKMLDYMIDFNRKYEKSERWKKDKMEIDAWTIGYKQADIIKAVNILNFDLLYEMVKTKTTFIDDICPEDEIQAHDIRIIGKNITKQNIDYIRNMFRDKKVSREAMAGLSEWIEKKSMPIYKKLNKNPNIPQKYIGEVGAILNDNNYDFVISLAQNKNVPKEEIALIGKYYNEHSASVLKYLIEHIEDKRIKYSKEEIWTIGGSINEDNKEYIEKLCKNTKIPLKVIDEVAGIVNKDNYNIITLLGADEYNYLNEIQECAYKTTERNRKFIETISREYKLKAKDVAVILNDLYVLEIFPIESIILSKKCSILNTYAEYGDLMKECGINFEDKIKAITNTVQNNNECAKSENLQEFLSKILANNNPEAENFLKTYDFAQFGKNGIPLEYSRKDFAENIQENILSGIKAEDKRMILEHFGIVDSNDYDGLWNNQEIDKSTLISEKGKTASEKVKRELDKFLYENETKSNDKLFNKILNGLIKGFPQFIPLVGKIQHETHDYSVDIHTLKVLQSCLNNPMYNELSDEGKTILKFSALMHDIGKDGKVRDPKHAEKSAKYTRAILENISISDDVKSRIINIIKNHHWFAGYNENNQTSMNVAASCRLKEDFIIYQILAKADLENVSDSFHLRVTKTKNQKEFKQYFDKKMKPIADVIDKISKNANIVYHTKILNKGNKFPKQKVKLESGEEIELKVLNLSELPEDANLEQYGFPKGTTRKNARFLVHMTKSGINFDVVLVLINSPLENSAWSTSLISMEYNNTYGDSPYGFIFDVRQENIAEAYFQNTGSGYQKGMPIFEQILFDFDNKERKFIRNNLQKELKLHGIWLNDNEYGKLVNYLEKKKHISAIRKDIKIGNKKIKANTLVKCLEKSRDSILLKQDHNEIVVMNPKIQGLIVKYNSLKDCNDNFLIFAHKHNLPVILLGD